MRPGRLFLAVVGALLSTNHGISAAAEPTVETKARCTASYEQAQTLRREERLAAARAQLLVCGQVCPTALARDCATWTNEVDALMPTVRLVVRDENGSEVSDPIVSIDGRAVITTPGESIRVDPGIVVFHVARRGGAEVDIRVEVHASERDHLVDVVLAATPKAKPLDPVPADARADRTFSYVAGGIGITALAAAGALAIKGQVDKSELRSTCAPICPEADVDAIRTLWWVAGGTAAVGAVAVGVAILLWPRRSPTRVARTLTLSWDLP